MACGTLSEFLELLKYVKDTSLKTVLDAVTCTDKEGMSDLIITINTQIFNINKVISKLGPYKNLTNAPSAKVEMHFTKSYDNCEEQNKNIDLFFHISNKSSSDVKKLQQFLKDIKDCCSNNSTCTEIAWPYIKCAGCDNNIPVDRDMFLDGSVTNFDIDDLKDPFCCKPVVIPIIITEDTPMIDRPEYKVSYFPNPVIFPEAVNFLSYNFVCKNKPVNILDRGSECAECKNASGETNCIVNKTETFPGDYNNGIQEPDFTISTIRYNCVVEMSATFCISKVIHNALKNISDSINKLKKAPQCISTCTDWTIEESMKNNTSLQEYKDKIDTLMESFVSNIECACKKYECSVNIEGTHVFNCYYTYPDGYETENLYIDPCCSDYVPNISSFKNLNYSEDSVSYYLHSVSIDSDVCEGSISQWSVRYDTTVDAPSHTFLTPKIMTPYSEQSFAAYAYGCVFGSNMCSMFDAYDTVKFGAEINSYKPVFNGCKGRDCVEVIGGRPVNLDVQYWTYDSNSISAGEYSLNIKVDNKSGYVSIDNPAPNSESSAFIYLPSQPLPHIPTDLIFDSEPNSTDYYVESKFDSEKATKIIIKRESTKEDSEPYEDCYKLYMLPPDASASVYVQDLWCPGDPTSSTFGGCS